ncbi:MAG: HAD-IIB family hydrolase [Austwickia sp.]|nr:HAD-IIB family hydrolase [Actinomycetota bacterium]MCO5309230.1 HAD-IIB family hydrolase [Austwickia sp.]
MRIADPDQLSSVLARLDIAVVALDVDGTLLTSAHRITPRLVTAVTAARAAGVSIVLASSRGPSVLRPILDGLGLATDVDFVASGGGYLGRRDTDGQFRAVARRTMSIQAARAFAAQVLTCGLAVNWFAGERWWATSRDAGVAYEIAAVGVEPELITADALLRDGPAPEKILVIAPPESPELLTPVRAALPPFAGQLSAVTSNPTYLEITAAGVDKAWALRQLLQNRGLTAAHLLAMGDGANDVPMLSLAGLAVAPANAGDPARTAADLIVADHDAYGAAQVLEALAASRAGR